MDMNGQGHGVAGRFLGLADEFADLKQAAMVILPVPFELTTTYQKGTSRGPEALIEASRNIELYDIDTDSAVYKLGIYTAPPIQASTSQAMLQALESQVIHYSKQKKFVLTLGGEHSISLGAIRAHAHQGESFSILQLDAHADLQDTYEGNPLSHASVMARVKELPAIANIVSVGIRSLSPAELPLIQPDQTFFAHRIQESNDWMDRVVQKLADVVYITIDLDVFDCALMPATGTPEPGGLSWYQVNELLKRVIKRKRVIGCDIVELCPLSGYLAPDYVAAKLAYKLLSYQFQGKILGKS